MRSVCAGACGAALLALALSATPVRADERHGGARVWYAPRGSSFVVVAAPVGMFVPVLPPFYTTLWIGGLPYYYANDTYYVWRDAQDGYEVVDPPNDPGGRRAAGAGPAQARGL